MGRPIRSEYCDNALGGRVDRQRSDGKRFRLGCLDLTRPRPSEEGFGEGVGEQK